MTTIAGSADIWGWESAINFAPDEFWLFSAGLAYTDAEWDDAQLESLYLFPSFSDAACREAVDANMTPPSYCGRIDGQQVARQPPWQGNLSATFTSPIGVNWLNEIWDVYGRADFTYEDDWFPQDDNLARIQDHTYVNLRAGLQSERYSVELWVKNLFEEDDASASFRDVFFGNTDNIYYDQPVGSGPNQFFPYRYTVNYPTLRTWGVTVRARFGGE